MLYVYHHQRAAKPHVSSICLLGKWQSPVPGFSLGSCRWHQTGCVCLAIPRRWKSRLETGKPSFICAYYPASWSILDLILWIWGRMRLCFLQIVKDLMEWKMKKLFCDLHYFFHLWANKDVQWFWHWWFYNFKGVCQTRNKVLLFQYISKSETNVPLGLNTEFYIKFVWQLNYPGWILAETFLRPPLNIEFDAFACVIVLDCIKKTFILPFYQHQIKEGQ